MDIAISCCLQGGAKPVELPSGEKQSRVGEKLTELTIRKVGGAGLSFCHEGPS